MELFALLYFSFSLIALLIATHTDIKQRIVSDKITYGLVALGLLLHGMESFLTGSIFPLVVSAVVCAATFFFGFLLWKIGLWAGGDVKLFTGIAAMLPINPGFFGELLGIQLLKSSSLPVFPLSLFIFSVVAMLPYGLFLALLALKRKKEKAKKIVNDVKSRTLQICELCIATIGFSELLSGLSLNQLFVLPLLLVLGLVGKRTRIAAVLLVGFFAVARQGIVFFQDFFSLFLSLFVLYLILKLGTESQGLLNSRKKVEDLKEGDIVAETIVENKGVVSRFSGVSIGKIINCIKSNNLHSIKSLFEPDGKVVCSHRRAGGLTLEEIKELKKLSMKGLLGETIEIKQSVAFVPAILIAFVLLGIIGDLFWNILFA